MVRIIALVGKAGSGKDTILHGVMGKFPDRFHEIISCTTRPPREGEEDGVNYHFLSVDEFTERLLNGDLLEATEFNGWHYGTLRSDLVEDKINIGIFNPEGVLNLMESFGPELLVIEVTVKDKERLMRQLLRETDPDVEEIIRRYHTDKEDFLNFHSFLAEMSQKIFSVENTDMSQLAEIIDVIGQL